MTSSITFSSYFRFILLGHKLGLFKHLHEPPIGSTTHSHRGCLGFTTQNFAEQTSSLGSLEHLQNIEFGFNWHILSLQR